MDRQYIDKHHIVERYLADLLPDGERAAFEAYYLEHPEIVKEMESVARFKAGMLQLQDSGELEKIMQAPSRAPRWPYLAAAAAIAAVAVGISYFGARDTGASPLMAATLAQLTSADSPQLGVASTHRIMRTRSTAADAQIVLPVPLGAIELEILPEIEDATARFSATLRPENGAAIIARADGLGANANGFVPVYLNPSTLTPGRYVLELESASASRQDSSLFSIQVLQ